MIPPELKVDKDGLLYLEGKSIMDYEFLPIDKRKERFEAYYYNGFYKVFGDDEYILKYCYTCYTKKEIKAIKNMLLNLRNKQEKIPSVDFPIGYYIENKKLCGTIIKNYPNSISLDNIFNLKDIELLGKYYYHDENNIHNLFLLFNRILDLLYEMFENGVYYTDTNPGNIVLYNNDAKIIDFDFGYIKFDNKDKLLKNILQNYFLLVNQLLTKVNLHCYVSIQNNSFENSKEYVKRLENNFYKR